MSAPRRATFADMAREFPVRTGLFTLVPISFALVLFVNSYVHGGSLLFTGWFSLAVVCYAALVNRYHLAAFQRAELSRRI